MWKFLSIIALVFVGFSLRRMTVDRSRARSRGRVTIGHAPGRQNSRTPEGPTVGSQGRSFKMKWLGVGGGRRRTTPTTLELVSSDYLPSALRGPGPGLLPHGSCGCDQ